MFSIFAIQDLFALIDKLRVDNPDSERINEPANNNHYWRYRIHVPLEDLQANRQLIDKVRGMVDKSHRT